MTVELIWKAAALCLITAVLAVVLKRTSPELTLLLAISGCAMAALCLLEQLSGLLDFIGRISASGWMDEELLAPLWKILGIVIVCRSGGALCRDAGQSGLAELLDTAGACGAMVVSLPLWEAAWELVEGLL